MNRIEALQDCLGAEHAALFGYGALGGVLAGVPRGEPDLERARSSYAAHSALRDALTELISTKGAQPTAAAPAYHLPFALADGNSCRRLARLLERRAASVFGLAVAATVEQDRVLVATALMECVLREVAWGGVAEPFPAIPEL